MIRIEYARPEVGFAAWKVGRVLGTRKKDSASIVRRVLGPWKVVPWEYECTVRVGCVDTVFARQDFKKEMNAKCASIQGSGWGWLGYNASKDRVEIATCPNQDPLYSTTGLVPLLGIDMWECVLRLGFEVFFLPLLSPARIEILLCGSMLLFSRQACLLSGLQECQGRVPGSDLECGQFQGRRRPPVQGQAGREEVNRQRCAHPLARDYEPDIRVCCVFLCSVLFPSCFITRHAIGSHKSTRCRIQ